jgi:hypothetical protein
MEEDVVEGRIPEVVDDCIAIVYDAPETYHWAYPPRCLEGSDIPSQHDFRLPKDVHQVVPLLSFRHALGLRVHFQIVQSHFLQNLMLDGLMRCCDGRAG